jgi:hypothetical protein
LLYDGTPIADTLVLGHESELTRLAELTPAATDIAFVAGDPAYDRMIASTHLRSRYRRALGIEPGQKLVALCTTWSLRSLLGSWPSLFREVIACLPHDEYRVVGLIHPNIWHGHGPWMVHTWLADAVRAGLLLPDPAEGWQAALVASDVIVGDHSATSCYGACLDLPVLLAGYSDADVAPGSVGALLGASAPRLTRREPLRAQIDRAITEHRPGTFAPLTRLISSHPGQAITRLRALCYAHLDLPEPTTEPVTPVIPPELVTAGRRGSVHADHVVCAAAGPQTFAVSRYPADVETLPTESGHLDAAVLIAHEDYPQRALLNRATVVLAATTDRPAEARAALGDALRRHPAATIAATTMGDHGLLLVRDHGLIEASGADAAIAAAVVCEWLMTHGPDLPDSLFAVLGTTRVEVRLSTR